MFLSLGLAVQVLTYCLMPDSPWSLVSGLLGICSVVLGAQGNILTFVFGFAQVGTYTYLCVQERFYAEIALNIFYFLTMIYGVYVWKRRLTDDDSLQIQKYLKENYPHVHFLPTVGTYIEILGQGVDKGTGLLRLADILEIPHNRVFAVGDGFNDVEMLVAANGGFVPENGSKEALAVAKYVTRSNNEGCIAHAIEILGEMYK